MTSWDPNSNGSSDDSPINWATDTIEPDPKWLAFVDTPPFPELPELTDQAIAHLGLGKDDVNYIAAIITVAAVITESTEHYMKLSGDWLPYGVDELESILSRQDFSLEILRNFLTHCGIAGVAIIKQLHNDIASGSVFERVAELIADGDADFTRKQVD